MATASEYFLKQKGLLSEDKSEFIIKFDDGREVILNSLLEEYVKQIRILEFEKGVEFGLKQAKL